jgi:hypothetical protein
MPQVHAYSTLVVAGAIHALSTLSAVNDTPVDWEAQSTLDLDATPAAIAQPTGATVQEAGIEVRVNGTIVPRQHFIGTIEVQRNRREHVQQGSFSVGLTEWGTSPLGNPFTTLGAPMGLREIDFYGVYRSDTTGEVFKYPLLLRGIAHDPGRESGPGGHTEHHTALDPGARWARVPTTLVLKAGHGIPTGKVTGKALVLAGEDATKLELQDGLRRYKEIQFVDADPVDASQELLDVEGRTLYWNRYGKAVNPLLEPDSYAGAVTLTEADILNISVVTVGFPADAVTKVIATGTEQIHDDEADVPCGLEAGVPSMVITSRTFKVWEPSFTQLGDCSLSVFSQSAQEIEQIYSMTISQQTMRCGVLQQEVSESWGWLDPEAARYQWATGTRSCIGGVYLDADATDDPDDGQPAYRDHIAKWTLLGRVTKTYYYDAAGWTGPILANEVFKLLTGHGGNPVTSTGAYIGSITNTEGWYNLQTATKTRPAITDAWEDQDVRDVYQLGGGTTVVDPYESFQQTSQVVEVVQSSAYGFIETVRTFNYGYAIKPNGQTYLYTDGSMSSEPDEQNLLLTDETVSYVATVENQHTQTTVTVPFGEAPTIVSENVAGAPPAVEYLPEFQPLPSSDLTDEETAFTVDAVAGETKPIKVEVAADGLLTTHLPRLVKTSFPYAEDLEELSNAAARIIRESLLITIDLTLSANYLIAEGQTANVTHHPIGLVDVDCVVNSATYTDQIGGPKTTRLELERYPIG